MISVNTIQAIRQFCRPAIDAGVIPPDQFRELIALAKTTTSEQSTMERPAPVPARMLTAGQVAKMLNCSVKSVYRMKNDKRLPGLYLTDSKKSLRFSEKKINSLFEEGDAA